MAKSRIQIDLILDREATADNLISFIQTRLAAYDIFSIDSLLKYYAGLEAPRDNRWHLVVHMRVNISANCDDLRDKLKDRWQTGQLANRILAGSRIALHSCTHEEQTPKYCIEDEIWVK